jgi:hypothetical protein
MLARIRKERKHIEKMVPVSFSTPGKSKLRRRRIVAAVDDFY